MHSISLYPSQSLSTSVYLSHSLPLSFYSLSPPSRSSARHNPLHLKPSSSLFISSPLLLHCPTLHHLPYISRLSLESTSLSLSIFICILLYPAYLSSSPHPSQPISFSFSLHCYVHPIFSPPPLPLS